VRSLGSNCPTDCVIRIDSDWRSLRRCHGTSSRLQHLFLPVSIQREIVESIVCEVHGFLWVYLILFPSQTFNRLPVVHHSSLTQALLHHTRQWTPPTARESRVLEVPPKAHCVLSLSNPHHQPPNPNQRENGRPTTFGPYLLLQTLGKGEFGRLKLGLHMQWGEEVVVKLARRENLDTPARMSRVEREIDILRVRLCPLCRLFGPLKYSRRIRAHFLL